MKVPIRAALLEAQSLARTLKAEEASPGPVLVTGMLSEQLARELAAGAVPGAVAAGTSSGLAGASVVVHVMAGEPSAADSELVREADALGVPVVLVQLWPQSEWERPFVLTPFVVECPTGQGFPLSEIAARIVEAVAHPQAVARRVPVLREPVARGAIGAAAARAALIAALARGRPTRALLTLEQVRMLVELDTVGGKKPSEDGVPRLAGPAAAAAALGFVLRELARRGGRTLPAPLVNAAIAAAGTAALGIAFQRLGKHLQ